MVFGGDNFTTVLKNILVCIFYCVIITCYPLTYCIWIGTDNIHVFGQP